MTLDEFLLARLEGDESAEAQAQRAIVESYRSCVAFKDSLSAVNEPGQKLVTSGMVSGLRIAMQLLASLHTDHPDYKPEWAKL